MPTNIRSVKNDVEYWDIRWHKDSPCVKCKTFHCPVDNPICANYRLFLDEQLAILKERENKEREAYDHAGLSFDSMIKGGKKNAGSKNTRPYNRKNKQQNKRANQC